MYDTYAHNEKEREISTKKLSAETEARKIMGQRHTLPQRQQTPVPAVIHDGPVRSNQLHRAWLGNTG
jgi:hypothetical protein